MHVVEMDTVDGGIVNLDPGDNRRILKDASTLQDALINVEIVALNLRLELAQRDMLNLGNGAHQNYKPNKR
jgi:hypothetical protein